MSFELYAGIGFVSLLLLAISGIASRCILNDEIGLRLWMISAKAFCVVIVCDVIALYLTT